ncbi:hypothetical protein [Nocardioides sp.]|uniref:hypothetical protein n=1 Tax=Nocardioides sp. TaxID=35761 RepID=UPI0035190CCC
MRCSDLGTDRDAGLDRTELPEVLVRTRLDLVGRHVVLTVDRSRANLDLFPRVAATDLVVGLRPSGARWPALGPQGLVRVAPPRTVLVVGASRAGTALSLVTARRVPGSARLVLERLLLRR